MGTRTRDDTDTQSEGWKAPAPPAPWPELDGYAVQHLVRRTPAAEVYLAYYHALRSYREVAVVDRRPDVDAAELRRAIDLEVFAAGALRHPSIAPVVDVGLARDGRLYVATARATGRSLGELLAEEGGLTVRRALDLGVALVAVVGAAHAAGLVHGWLTPDSVVVIPRLADEPERVVVLGFGMTTAQDGAPAPMPFPGALYPYASPERANGEPASIHGDVFGLGSVLLAMYLGGPPPVVDGPSHAPPAAAEGADPSAAESPTVTQVLGRARAADPLERYATAADLGAALTVVRHTPAGGVAVRTPPYGAAAQETVGVRGLLTPIAAARLLSARRARRPARRRTLAAAGALGLLAAGAVFAWRGQRPQEELAFAPNATSLPDAAVAPPLAPNGMLPSTQPGPVTAPLPAPPLAVAPVPPPAATGPTAPPLPGPTARVSDNALRRVVAVNPPPATARTEAPAARRASGPADRAPAPLTRVLRTPRPARAVVAAAAPASTPPAESAKLAAAPPAVARPTVPAATPTVVTASAAGDVVAAGRAAEAANAAAGVRAAIAEYAAAIEARDLAGLRRVYPAMTEQQRSGWTAFFGSVANLRARLVVGDVTTAGGTARARVRGAYEYQNLRPHRAERLPVDFTATLTRDTSGWRVRAVQ